MGFGVVELLRCAGKMCGFSENRPKSCGFDEKFFGNTAECAGYRQFVRNLNPCARDLKIAVCSDVRDLDNFAIK